MLSVFLFVETSNIHSTATNLTSKFNVTQPSRQLQSTLKVSAELATKTPHTPSRICQPWALGARSDPCERAWKARRGPQSRVRPRAATLNPAEQKEASSQERGEGPPEE